MRTRILFAACLTLIVALSIGGAADAKKKKPKVKFSEVTFTTSTTWTQNATGPDSFTGTIIANHAACIGGREVRLKARSDDPNAAEVKTLRTTSTPDGAYSFTVEPQKGYLYQAGVASFQVRVSKRRVVVCQKAREVGNEIAIP